MPLMYYPRPGEIFICDYPKDMRVPEMVKTRPVVVISPRLRGRGNLITIVPLSATKPQTIMPYHYELSLAHPLPSPWDANPCWAICDHPMAVGFDRINLIRLGKDQYGKRKYYQHLIRAEDLGAIRDCVTKSFGL